MNAAVDDALASQVKDLLEYKVFPGSGSRGFYCQGRIAAGGKQYQASAQAVLIGSKNDPRMQVTATGEQAKDAVSGLIRAGLPAKSFRSGKTGYYAAGQLAIAGQPYQVQAQAVLLT